MIVVGISRHHNASVCLIVDGKVVLNIDSERLSNIKYSKYPFSALDLLKNYVDRVDVVAIAGLSDYLPQENFSNENIYVDYIKNLGKSFNNNDIKVYNYGKEHHLTHAASAFYNSGFENALCIVKDGMGSEVEIRNDVFTDGSYGRENMSVFNASYPNIFETMYKEVSVPFQTEPVFIENKTLVVNNLSEAMAFQKTAENFEFHLLDAGKVMGMAAYAKNKTKYKNIIYKNNGINNEVFVIQNSLHKTFLDISFANFQDQADFSYSLQKETQENVLEEIIQAHKMFNVSNICLSGGYFLNCVANYFYIKNLPKEINLYIEPISSDAGTALGAAKHAWHSETKSNKINKQTSIYYGPKYSLENIKIKSKKTSYKEVANLLSLGKVVAIYQGGSESGPRALGNRSILFDPRISDGKDIINKIKKREWFRPFAGSVIYEHANKWFDMADLDESPYMMYAVDVLEGRKKLIPSIVHVDGTCRIQTVKKENNPHFYKLIQAFYEITKVPILFNTSFNMAGNCIVETIDNALETIQKSNIDYLYLPEINKLISKLDI
jgi:carbamoyltransferase